MPRVPQQASLVHHHAGGNFCCAATVLIHFVHGGFSVTANADNTSVLGANIVNQDNTTYTDKC
jgi:hypothetical protein